MTQPANYKTIEQAKLRASFGFIYRSYSNKLYNYFLYRVGYKEAVAEDLVQETFVRAYEKFGSYENRGFSYLTYLMKIAHNLLVNYYRLRQPIPLEQIEDIPIEVFNEVEQKLEAEEVWKAVSDLSPNEQDVIFMKYQREMSVNEISQVIDKSENAVKLLLSRARKKLAGKPCLKQLVYVNYRDTTLSPNF
jgi:RNA polymerase sigma-70 factor (ECF subfamily)